MPNDSLANVSPIVTVDREALVNHLAHFADTQLGRAAVPGYSLDMAWTLGPVGHFGLAVRDPHASAAWWKKNFKLREEFAFDDVVGLSSDSVTIVFSKGVPHPGVLGHMSFHLHAMRELREALADLKNAGVHLEDPGDEIGPETPGSPHMGLWFHDPDGYRWELSVQNGAKEKP